MTKHALLLFILLLISCSTKKAPLPNKEKWKVSEMTIPEAEALRLIEQKRNFLLLTFEQIYDPNFQNLKWTNICIEENKISEIRKDERMVLWHSILYTGPEYRTGFCSEYPGAEKSSFVMLYCRKEKKLIQVNCLIRDCANVSWEQQC